MKKWKRQAALFLCILLLLPSQAVTAAEKETDVEKELNRMIPCTEPFLFEDGDIVGFIGDSITHVEYTGISYQEFLYNYYITRYPDWNLEFRNLGTASYKASDAVELYGDDSGIQDPAIEGITKAVIMFGMNEALDRVSAQRYISNMRKLVEILNERGLENEDIILVAPTPYDQTRSSNYAEDGMLIETTDDRISEYVPELKKLAEDLGTHYIDLHTPMLWVTEIVQGMIADDTLTVTDNVHPNAMGNTIAGFFFLYQQGAGKNVFDIHVTKEEKLQTENVSVKLQKKKGERYLRLKYKADSLPMAVSYEFHEATQYFEIIDEISWENLQIEGLREEKNYTVYMNYLPVAELTGAELAKGVNLTDCDWNPLQKAAKEIEVLNQQWQVASSDYRSVVREATKESGTATQEDVNAAYEVWKTDTENLRQQMYEIARENVQKTYTLEIVSEDYRVFMGQELWLWALEAAIAAGLFAACVIWFRKRRKKGSLKR